MTNQQQKGSLGSAPDVFAGLHGQPIISAGTNGKYLGRVIIEFYENPNENSNNHSCAVAIRSDPDGIAYSVDVAQGADLDHQTLLKRVASAFPERVAQVLGES